MADLLPTAAVICVAATCLLLAALLAYGLITDRGPRITAAIRRWRQRRYGYGPNANALFADIDQHLTWVLAHDQEFFEGLVRLEAAIRERQEGETP